MTEKQFSDWVIKMARERDWVVAHFHAATVRAGRMVTPVSADGKGFPDLVLCRERTIFAELKAARNYHLSDEQRRWLDLLANAGQEVYTWRPRQIEEILDTLECWLPPARLGRLIHASGGDIGQARRVALAIVGKDRGPLAEAPIWSATPSPLHEKRKEELTGR